LELGIIIAIYVDDSLVLYRDNLQQIVDMFEREFAIRVDTNAQKFLGINLEVGLGQIKIHAAERINMMLDEWDCHQTQAVKVPIFQLIDTSDERLVDQQEYRRLVGQLAFIAETSRPDITFAVNHCRRFQQKPTVSAMIAAKHVLKYLKGTINVGPVYRGGTSFKVYSDADYASDKTDRTSVSGYILFLGDTPVAWGSTKQRCVALSTAESEYIALTCAVKELQYIHNILEELPPVYERPVVFCDNQAALHILRQPGHEMSRAKHIHVRYHYIRHLFEAGLFDVAYVSSAANLADPLTKPLSATQFLPLRRVE
jgi:hypothetical protein